jgi:hemerythrin-like domain-containing protein
MAAPLTAEATAVMRSEHAQMRELLRELRDARAGCEAMLLADVVDRLLLLIQQHNPKQENVLYPTVDQTLADQLRARFVPQRAG